MSGRPLPQVRHHQLFFAGLDHRRATPRAARRHGEKGRPLKPPPPAATRPGTGGAQLALFAAASARDYRRSDSTCAAAPPRPIRGWPGLCTWPTSPARPAAGSRLPGGACSGSWSRCWPATADGRADRQGSARVAGVPAAPLAAHRQPATCWSAGKAPCTTGRSSPLTSPACAGCPPPWSGCGSTASSPRPWPPGSTRCTWPRSSASASTPRSATRSTPGN